MPKTSKRRGRADLVESLEDLLVDRHLAAEQADEDLAILADQPDGREPGTLEPGSADEEIVREFHRAIVHHGSGSLSGRML
jgi:hypothetical protein